ncbi:MAG: hypothetical protein ACREMI_04815 [Gemmatimonadales bacterium]
MDPELTKAFQRNFEDGMDQFRKQRNTDLSELIRDMARYFVRFSPGPQNLYRRLIRLIAKQRKDIVLASINYDILLELSINAEGYAVAYNYLPPVPANNVSVMKLHGSSNFLPDVRPNQFQDFSVVVNETGSILDGPVKAVDARGVLEFCSRENVVAPVLALYVKGKQVLFGRSFTEAAMGRWRDIVSTTARVFVVGVHPNPDDDHIWGTLARSGCRLFYVGPDRDSFLRWASNERRGRVHYFAESFETAIPLLGRVL